MRRWCWGTWLRTKATVGRSEGGIEALFLLWESTDEVIIANSLWALGNLAWHPHNQGRIGRFFEPLLRLCRPPMPSSPSPRMQPYASRMPSTTMTRMEAKLTRWSGHSGHEKGRDRR